MSFLRAKRHLFGFRAKGGDATEGCGGYQLREESARHKALLEAENGDIGPKTPIHGMVKPKNQDPILARLSLLLWNKLGECNLALLGTPVSWIIFPRISR